MARARANSKVAEPLPEVIRDEKELDEILTRPGRELVEFIKSVSSPLLIFGAGGKMGPSLAVLAKRAAEAAGHELEVLAVSRFRDGASREWLEQRGVKTLRADLLEAKEVGKLPEARDIVYLVGLKFGTEQNPAATWAANTIVPARICERYPKSGMVALSTGNVYPLSEVSRGGSVESDRLTPVGEYANAAVARERIFEFYSRENKMQIALMRLFYAVELRYGVMLDIARKVNRGEEISVENGVFNCIWQGDANEMILRALTLAKAPPGVWNLCRPEIFSVREIAMKLGELLGRTPVFSGRERETALVGNAAEVCKKLGIPKVSMETMLRWTAHWVKERGRNLERPTHFEVRDGKY